LHGWRLGVGLPRGLPGDHAPLLTALRVHGEVAHGEVLLLARVLHVHLRHPVDHPDASVHAGAALTRRDAPVVRLARPEIRDVLGFRLEPRGGVHVGQVVGERRVEAGPVTLAHGFETTVVGFETSAAASASVGIMVSLGSAVIVPWTMSYATSTSSSASRLGPSIITARVSPSG